jgi:hypothetical protein
MDTKEILSKIDQLKTEVEAMQADPLLRKDYREKVKELMRWRRRYTRLPRDQKLSTNE